MASLSHGSYDGWASQVAIDPAANAGDLRDTGSIPGLGRSLRGAHNYPLQFSFLENPMDREDRWAIIHRIAESDTTEAT